MMDISDELKQDAWSNESDLPLILLTISHSSLSEDIRVVNNKVAITSNGLEYIAFPFQIQLPDSKEDSQPSAKLTISNVSREIGQAIRLISTPPSITITVVRQDTPDIIEAQFVGMRLNNVKYDMMTVTADLEFEDLTREEYPSLKFSPSIFKGIL
ncbi:MAG TPA: DUF1833 family protein [Candidatus Omnitrophota bacterium]|nr:DUF1833 family protein [Candidatus Omnitrophota bacterium]